MTDDGNPSSQTVIFFGDSLTWGKYGGNYVQRIREQVGSTHEIIGAGEGGNTVVNLLRRLEEDVLAHEPDAVFVMIGGNDAISHSQPDTRSYYRKSMQIPSGEVTPDQFRHAYRELIETLQANYIATYIGLPPIEQNPTVVAAMQTYNEIAREVAQMYNIAVLDLSGRFAAETVPERKPLSLHSIQEIGERTRTGWEDWDSAQKEGGYSFTFDGVHWTPKVAEEAAALIIDFMELD